MVSQGDVSPCPARVDEHLVSTRSVGWHSSFRTMDVHGRAVFSETPPFWTDV